MMEKMENCDIGKGLSDTSKLSSKLTKLGEGLSNIGVQGSGDRNQKSRQDLGGAFLVDLNRPHYPPPHCQTAYKKRILEDFCPALPKPAKEARRVPQAQPMVNIFLKKQKSLVDSHTEVPRSGGEVERTPSHMRGEVEVGCRLKNMKKVESEDSWPALPAPAKSGWKAQFGLKGGAPPNRGEKLTAMGAKPEGLDKTEEGVTAGNPRMKVLYKCTLCQMKKNKKKKMRKHLENFHGPAHLQSFSLEMIPIEEKQQIPVVEEKKKKIEVEKKEIDKKGKDKGKLKKKGEEIGKALAKDRVEVEKRLTEKKEEKKKRSMQGRLEKGDKKKKKLAFEEHTDGVEVEKKNKNGLAKPLQIDVEEKEDGVEEEEKKEEDKGKLKKKGEEIGKKEKKKKRSMQERLEKGDKKKKKKGLAKLLQIEVEEKVDGVEEEKKKGEDKAKPLRIDAEEKEDGLEEEKRPKNKKDLAKPFMCSLCDSTRSTIEKIKKHLVMKHKGEGFYNTDDLNTGWKQIGDVGEIPVLRKRGQSKPGKVEASIKKVKNLDYLEVGIKAECPVPGCGKKFANAYTCKRHVISHHKEVDLDELTFPNTRMTCKYCGK